MKLQLHSRSFLRLLFSIVATSMIISSGTAAPSFFQDSNFQNYAQYKGKVINSENEDPLTSAYLVIEGTNISTITNSEGEFFLKVPSEHADAAVNVSHLGYQSKVLPSNLFSNGFVTIELREAVEELSEVSLYTLEEPIEVVREMLARKRDNYALDPAQMTAFYRETIRRGRRNVSLSEAVVSIHKKPYSSYSNDEISLVKARKSADYSRLDTLALKLRGGPFNPLVLDIMKNPDHMFYQEDLLNYLFEFDTPARINDRYLHVVNFTDTNQRLPWYHGKLYIDAETKALVKAEFELNVENRKQATRMFVKKKPGGTKVYPVQITYNGEYRQQDGKWYFGYGNTSMEFIVNWKRKLFNSRFKVNSELAITDWSLYTSPPSRDVQFINPDIVMSDDVSGFADIHFWGKNNIIEPDESIENAIEKIQKNLKND